MDVWSPHLKISMAALVAAIFVCTSAGDAAVRAAAPEILLCMRLFFLGLRAPARYFGGGTAAGLVGEVGVLAYIARAANEGTADDSKQGAGNHDDPGCGRMRKPIRPRRLMRQYVRRFRILEAGIRR